MSTNIGCSEPLLVDRAGLKALGVTFSNAWLLRLEADNRFPRRISLGSRKCCWLLTEIRSFISERAAVREASAIKRRRITRPGN